MRYHRDINRFSNAKDHTMFSPTYAPIRTITKTAPRETAEERAARECLEMWRRGLNRR